MHEGKIVITLLRENRRERKEGRGGMEERGEGREMKGEKEEGLESY